MARVNTIIMKAPRKKGMGWNSYHIKFQISFPISMQCILYLFFKISPPQWPNLGYYCCVSFILQISLLGLGYKGEIYMKVKACTMITIN
jgi:hypothetical protein